VSVGNIIGGIVGGVIGFMVGGPAGAFQGAMLGSSIGGMLFPPKGPDGPRLSDLRPQSSEYGRPIPKVFGTIALPGNVIWSSEYVEEASEQGGGCGEPSFNTFSYYGNFAVLVCVGEKSLGRIWAGPEKRLIYDGDRLEGEDSGAEIRFYSGAEDQLPDPLIESYEGVGNVPAWRGWVVVVLEHFPLAHDGDMIPMLTIEVGNVDANLAPLDLGSVGTAGPVHVDVAGDTYTWTYLGSTFGAVTRRLSTNAFISHYSLTDSEVSANSFLDPENDFMVYMGGAGTGVSWLNLSTGAKGSWSIFGSWPMPGGAGGTGGFRCAGGVHHNGVWTFLMHHTDGSVAISTVDPATLDGVDWFDAAGTLASFPLVENFAGHRADGDTYILGVSKAGVAYKFHLSDGATPTSIGACVSSSTRTAVDPNTGYVWTERLESGTLNAAINDPVSETQLQSHVLSTEAFSLADGGASGSSPYVFSPTRVVLLGYKWLATDYFIEFSPAGVFLSYITGVFHGVADISGGWYNPTTSRTWIVREYAWANKSTGLTDDLAHMAIRDANGEANGFYLGDRDSTITAEGQPLDEVVAELSEMAGLSASEIDVTALASDTVDGYAIATQTTVREAITALMPAYFFDGVESGGKVKFVKRGGASAVTIPDGDIGAYEDGSQPVAPQEITRAIENHLPRRLTISYLLAATNYSQATKYAARLTGSSQEESAMDFPLVMSDTKAQEVAEVNLHGMWVARLGYQFTLPYEYAYLEPTDVVTIGIRRLLIKKITQSGTIFKVEAASDGADVYTPNVIVTETTPIGDDEEVFTPADTIMELM